jgi:polysaccharide export outer membrane protein
MKLRPFILLINLVCAGVAVNAQEAAPAPAPAQATPADAALLHGYTLGAGDQVAGGALGEIGYDFVTTVDEDGLIKVPFIPDKMIVAQCRTEREIQADIETEIKKYVREPHFSFRIVEKHSRPPVTVSGEIVKPMEITLTRPRTLIEILSLAGGLKEEASGQIQVTRPKTPMCMAENDPDNWKADSSSRTYSYASIKLGNNDSNPTIYPGDAVNIVKAPPVYINGEVVAGQGVYLKESGLSLTEALGMVGGHRPDADIKRIEIYRLKAGSGPTSKDRDLIAANIKLIREGKQKDIMLQPYDIVLVGKAKKSVGLMIAEVALNAGKTLATGFANATPYRVIY